VDEITKRALAELSYHRPYVTKFTFIHQHKDGSMLVKSCFDTFTIMDSKKQIEELKERGVDVGDSWWQVITKTKVDGDLFKWSRLTFTEEEWEPIKDVYLRIN
jgi:hypothetical protein